MKFVLLALLLTGCAARKPVKVYGPVKFEHCFVIDGSDGASCQCGRFTIAIDAKSGETIALCSGNMK